MNRELYIENIKKIRSEAKMLEIAEAEMIKFVKDLIGELTKIKGWKNLLTSDGEKYFEDVPNHEIIKQLRECQFDCLNSCILVKISAGVEAYTLMEIPVVDSIEDYISDFE